MRTYIVGDDDVRKFLKAFAREDWGTWRCIAPADLNLPSGRVQVTPGTVFTKGTSFMNVDIAELLEAEYQRLHNAAGERDSRGGGGDQDQPTANPTEHR
jgi:hypothetical protein